MSQFPIPATARPRLAVGTRLGTDNLTGHPVLLYPEGVLQLNPTGADILRLCDGHRSFDEIVSALSAEYGVGAAVLKADVTEYFQRLLERVLIVLTEPGT